MATRVRKNYLGIFKFVMTIALTVWTVQIACGSAAAQSASLFFQGQVPDLTSPHKNVHQTIASFSDVAAVRLLASESEIVSGHLSVVARGEGGEVLPSRIVRGESGAMTVGMRPIVLVQLAAKAEQIVTLCIGQSDIGKLDRCYRYRVLRVDPS